MQGPVPVQAGEAALDAHPHAGHPQPAGVIDGGAGDDVIAGRGGIDILKGGLGSDTLSYAGSAAGVIVALDGNNPASVTGGDAAGDTATDYNFYTKRALLAGVLTATTR